MCIDVIEEEHKKIPTFFIPYLIAAEDHRFFQHYGIDPFSILRAVKVYVLKRKVQGASTIEQQFVRVVTKRYERTLYRKIREQILAMALTRATNKISIARGYLAIAYYGSLYQGEEGIEKLMSKELSLMTSTNILGAVARLKYPEPLAYTEEWNSKLTDRINYIQSRRQTIS